MMCLICFDFLLKLNQKQHEEQTELIFFKKETNFRVSFSSFPFSAVTFCCCQSGFLEKLTNKPVPMATLNDNTI